MDSQGVWYRTGCLRPWIMVIYHPQRQQQDHICHHIQIPCRPQTANTGSQHCLWPTVLPYFSQRKHSAQTMPTVCWRSHIAGQAMVHTAIQSPTLHWCQWRCRKPSTGYGVWAHNCQNWSGRSTWRSASKSTPTSNAPMRFSTHRHHTSLPTLS